MDKNRTKCPKPYKKFGTNCEYINEISGLKMGWWWTQSGANPSQINFPVKQGKNREIY